MIELKNSIDNGASLEDIREHHFSLFVRYGNAIERIMMDKKGRRDWMTEVVIYWGPTGTGKSKRAWYEARKEFGEDEVHQGPIGKWWEGYRGQSAIILDDWYPDEQECKLGYWLKLFDRYPTLIEKKGTSAQFLAKKVWITTNQNPGQFWDGQPQDKREAWERRIVKIERMANGVWQTPEEEQRQIEELEDAEFRLALDGIDI